MHTQVSHKVIIDRSYEISRETEFFMRSLLEYQNAKCRILQKPSLAQAKKTNMKYKKLEEELIVKENLHLISRLSLNNSELSFKNMIKDYKVIEEYREMISRKQFKEHIKKAVKVKTKVGASVTPRNSIAETPIKLCL